MSVIDFLKKREVIDFIGVHADEDPHQLLLNPPAIFREKIKVVVDQIQARKKGRGKLDSWVTKDQLIFPPPLSVEQASSEATSRYKKKLISGNQLIDLTGGTGIDCLALAEGFKSVTYVEQDSHLCEVFSHNASTLGKEVTVVNSSAENFLNEHKHIATYYLDPARRDASKKKVFQLEDCTPNILELLPLLRSHAKQVLIKLSPLLDLEKTVRDLENIKEIHVVSVKNECKELLLLLDFSYEGEATIHAVNLESSQLEFTFKRSEENELPLEAGTISQFLYEPNASILKAGAFKVTAHAFGMEKIAANTHLYTSPNLIQGFPGKAFKVSDEKAKVALKNHQGTINVITRNFSQSATELKKKYKLKDGGASFLIGFRDAANKPNLVIANRLY